MNGFKNACGCDNYKNALGVEGAPQNSKSLDVNDTVKDSKVDFFDAVKGGATATFEMVEDTAENVYDEAIDQKEKLDKKERLIKSVPNSLLVFGLAGILVFSLVKK